MTIKDFAIGRTVYVLEKRVGDPLYYVYTGEVVDASEHLVFVSYSNRVRVYNSPKEEVTHLIDPMFNGRFTTIVFLTEEERAEYIERESLVDWISTNARDYVLEFCDTEELRAIKNTIEHAVTTHDKRREQRVCERRKE